MGSDVKKWLILLQHLRDGYARSKDHKYELNEAIVGIQALEAERDQLLQKTQQLEAERDKWKETASNQHRGFKDLEAERDLLRCKVEELNDALITAPVRLDKYVLATENDDLRAERDRYAKALETIELMDSDWTMGVDENMGRLQSIAGRALKGGGDG